MVSLIGRFAMLIKRCFDALLAPAEDPRQSYTNAYQRQRALLIRVQKALSEIGATKQRLESKTAEVRVKLPQLQDRARSHLADGREDLARLTLQRRQVALAELQSLEKHVREVQDEERRLSLTEQKLSTQIEAFFARQELIAARYSAAEAQVRIQEAFGGVSDELSELGRALEQAEEKSMQMQARAAAIDRLVEDGILQGPAVAELGDGRLKQLDVDEDVEMQLAALKSELA